MLQKYLICYAFLKREGFKKKKNGMMGGQIESKKVWTVRPPLFALNPVGTRPGGIFPTCGIFPPFL